MVARKLTGSESRQLTDQVFAEAGLDPRSHLPHVAIQMALHEYRGGMVYTSTDECGNLCLIAEAPFSNFTTPTAKDEVETAAIRYRFLRNIEALLGRPLCQYEPNHKRKQSKVIIPITEDLASVQ